MKQQIFKTLAQEIEKRARLKKPRIAFGLIESDKEILKSLKQGQKYADIVLVGPRKISKIKSFKKIISSKPEEKIVKMLINGEVEGIIRGTLDDFKTYETYCYLTGHNRIKDVNPVLIKDFKGRYFFVCPVSNPEGWVKKEKERIIKEMNVFLQKLDIVPKIAVFSGTRPETYERKRQIRSGVIGFLNKTYEDAEQIVKDLKPKKINIVHYSIDMNKAVEDGCNLIVPINGMIGNQWAKAIFLLGGGEIIAAPKISLKHKYEDNSRSEKNFINHIKYLTFWINSNK
jgi:predicted methyltransferase MtxX (methanogen marker protein 4)